MADNEDPKREKKNRGTDTLVCGYPLSIFFIVVNEFCERFSYYGMRAVLVLYFKFFLGWSDDRATSIYHVFVALCYLTPILGAIVADSWLGKFKTIIYLSIVYAVGQVAMAISAVHDITDYNADGKPDELTFHVVLSMVGLFLIALGTGGIKPCVAAFGGDQFSEHQDRQRRTFFSVFYLCINGGSLLSTIITPILRAQQCGTVKASCYPLAFGVPAALMVIALVVFIAGSGMYYKAEPEGNIMLSVCKCMSFAISNRFRNRRAPAREHWMDWAEERYDKLLIAQIKMVLKVLFLYIPLPFFWTLFDQKGSRWTLQATTMNGDFGLMTVQPDQMQTINPILILTLVPIMDNLVYPLIKKCGLNFTPLKRMTVGMILAATAFACAAVVQSLIDGETSFPSNTQAQLKILNAGSTPLKMELDNLAPLQIPAAQANGDYLTFNVDGTHVNVRMVATKQGQQPVERFFHMPKAQRYTVVIPENATVAWNPIEDLTSRPNEGNVVRFLNGMDYAAVNITAPGNGYNVAGPHQYSQFVIKGKTTTFTVAAGAHKCDYSMELGYGSSYVVFIPRTFIPAPTCQDSFTVIENIPPTTVHMALQIPQYFFITAGEVMFSVTGLEFSYSQAPSNMKAVLQAGWLFTVAIGNFIVLLVDVLVESFGQLPEVWMEYLLFSCLLLAVCVIFSIMAYFYTYIDPVEVEAEFKKQHKFGEDDEEREKKVQIEMVRRDSSSSSSSSDDDSDKPKQMKL